MAFFVRGNLKMCGSIFFRKVGRAMMKKENKKTEPDVKNNDRQKEKNP